ncbi:hypothetical protein EYF80_067677 [Liparis tanakae]|uniref:Uncharacterized protein n=1 Tax=Liparis tanakae TaxID=230148 RepID=A0A4Z2E0E9_9TELE|nr:hypothetical protein EYF80_067677 [Liparis tanakae]
MEMSTELLMTLQFFSP